MSSSQERTARSFVERHGLWSDEQFEAAARADKWIEEQGLEVVRLSFPDQHGILRGKTVVANEAASAMRNGCSITTTLLAKDTAHKTVFPVFTAGGGFGMAEMEGGGDFLMIADPLTFRVLPWAQRTGWVLCDIYFANGKPVPFSTRHLYRRVLQRLAEGKVYKQIAHELTLSTSTVRTHLHNIYGKLGAVDRAQAVLIATERGWL